jgi:hypothetical protein
MKKSCEECGGEFEATPWTFERRRYCSYACRNQNYRQRIGPANPKWKGGRDLSLGYVLLKVPGERRYIREHRAVMEQVLGRALNPHEIVHHKNGNKLDNRPDNLELVTRANHTRMHGIAGWNKGQCSALRLP